MRPGYGLPCVLLRQVDCHHWILSASAIPTALLVIKLLTQACCAGIRTIHDLGQLDDVEKAGLEGLKQELASSIDKGVAFMKGNV